MPVTNAGQGTLTDFLYWIIDPPSLVPCGIKVNGVDIGPPTATNGDTLFYNISGSLFNSTFGATSNGDDFFDFNESILICEVWKGEDCADTTPIIRGTRYGCDGDDILAYCQESNIVNTGVSYDFALPEMVVSRNEALTVRPACYADENTVIAIDIKNDGVAPAKDLIFNITQSGLPGALVAASLKLTKADASMIVGTAEDPVSTGASQACSAGAGNIRDAAATFLNVNLMPGETVTITYELNHGCDCSGCTIENIYGSTVSSLKWTDLCDREFVNNSGISFAGYDARLQGFFQGESFATGGSTCVSYQITSGTASWMQAANSADYPNAYFETQLTVECGLDLTSFTYINNSGTAVPGATTIVSNPDGGLGADDMPIIRIDRNVSGTFEICFNVDCAEKPGGGGCPSTANFSMTNYFVADGACAATCLANVSCESSFATVFNCPPCGPCDGLTHLELDISRTNYGEYDSNNDGIGDGDPADENSIGVKPKRFLAGDTLKATLIGIVNDGATAPNPHLWDHAFLELDVLTPDFSILGGDFRVWDQSAGTYLECGALSQFAAGSTYVTDLSVPSMTGLACTDFDGFQYADGDSLFLCVYFAPKEPLFNQQSKPIIYEPEWYLSDDPMYNTDMDRCNFLLETLNQIGVTDDEDIVIGGRNFGGCEFSPFTIRHTIYYGSLGFDEFCNEIRNPGIPEKYTFVKPPEFQWCMDNFRFRSREYFGPDSDEFDDIIPPSFLNVIGEDTVCFFAKNYIESLENIQLDEGNRFFFYPCIQGNCMSEKATYSSCSMTVFDVDDQVFCQDKFDFSEKCENWDYTGGPILEVNAITPVIELFEPGGCARIKVNNVTNIPAPNTWLNIDDIFDGMVVTSMVQDPDGAATTLTPTSLGIYPIGNFPAGGTIEFEVCANVTDCNDQRLEFVAGWDCNIYPATVEEAICSNPSTVDFVTVPGGIDANVLEPSGNLVVDLCEEICFKYSVTSTQLGNIQDIFMSFVLPTGMNYVPGTFGLAYPITIADTTFMTIPDPSNNFDNAFFSTISDFHPILADEGLIGSPGAPDLLNQVIVEFKAVTDCTFRSGSLPRFATWAYDACGDRTRRVFNRGGKIFIDGAIPEYEIDITLGELELNPCNNDQANVDFDLTISADDGIVTSPGDSVVVILPEGIDYISGTYSTSANASGAAPDVSVDNGQTTLGWEILPGLIDGDQIVFDLDIEAVDVGQICGEYEIAVQTFSTTNTSCGDDDCNIAVLSGEQGVLINIEKPALEIVQMDLNLVNMPPSSQTIEYCVKVMNNGNVPQLSATPINIELWSDNDANGLLDMMTDNLATTITEFADIAPGEMMLIKGEMAVTAGALCKVLGVINAETTCTCETSTSNQADATIENIFDLEPKICSDEIFAVGPDPIAGFDYEWLSVGGSNLAALSATNVSPANFQFTNTTGADINLKYALRTSFGNCYSYDTLEVTLHPAMMDVVSLSACESESFVLPGPVEGENLVWTPATNLDDPMTNFPLLDPVPAGFSEYNLSYTDANGCPATKKIQINGIGCAPDTGIGDTVWFDINEDGLQDIGEPGIPGVTVFLYNATNTSPGNHISATMTDADGYYDFTGLPAGNYAVGFIDPAGFVITVQNVSSDGFDQDDSDPDAGTGVTGPYFLPNGIFNPTVDAGYIPDCLLEIEIENVSECTFTGDGHVRTADINITWNNAVFTYDFLNGSETIEVNVGGDPFTFVIDELSGDTSFVYTFENSTTIDLLATATLATDSDCIADFTFEDITGCIYDLALIKDMPFLPNINYGDIIPFTITVENQGAQPLTNIKINDFLPEGFGFDMALNPLWMVSAVDTLMYFITDPMLPGDVVNIPLNLEVLMHSGDPEAWLNKAEIFSMEDIMGNDRSLEDIDSTPDADPDNDAGGIPNTGSDDTLMGDGSGSMTTTNPNTDEDDEDPELITIVDLALVKELVTPAPYAYGDPITFDITVYNQGSVTATDILVQDFIPAGFAWDPINAPDWGITGSTATNTIAGPLAPGQEITVSITLTLQSADSDEYVNISEIGMFSDADGNDITGDDIDSTADDNPDNDAGGNPGTESDNVNGGDGTGSAQDQDADTDEDDSDPAYVPVPLIDIEKSTVGVVPASSGIDGHFDATYELVVTNPGNVKLTCLLLQDDLVEQLGSTFEGVVTAPATISLTDAQGVPTVQAGYNGGVVDTIFNGKEGCLNPDETITVQFTVELSSLDGPEPVINQANISGKDPFETIVMDQDTAIVELPDCFLQVNCPQENVSLSCPSELPAAGTTAAWFNGLDPFSAIVMSCGIPTLTVVDADNDGSGCSSAPLIVTRTITINDPGDGTTVAETHVCTVTYTIVDDESPTIICPGNLVAECDADDLDTYDSLAEFIAAGGFVEDNCGVTSFAHVGDTSDGNTCPETITRTYSITDECGNISMCNQLITINDQTPPVLGCPDITTSCDITDIPAYTTFAEFTDDGNGSSDNCGIDASTFELVEQTTDGNTCPAIYIRKYKVTDLCGNIGTSIQTITIDDEQAPTFNDDIPMDITIQCDDPIPATAELEASDNCGVATVSVVESSTKTSAGSCSDHNYVITRRYTASDACGNEVSDTQLITVVDTKAPTAICCDDFVLNLDANGSASIDVDDIDCGSVDNCTPTDDLLITVSPSVFDVNDIGDQTVVMTVSDLCGNSSTCELEVTVVGSPDIGLAKRISDVDFMDDGCVEITYEFNIVNYGNTALSNLVLTDDLSTAFGSCDGFSIDEITSDDFIVNDLYNGTATSNMLLAGNTLQINDKGAVLLTVEACGCGDATIVNKANIEGTVPDGSTVDDDSDDGSDPDGDGDGDPSDDDDETELDLDEDASIGVAKRLVSAELQDDGCTELVYEFNIENFGNVNLSDIQLVDDLDAAGFSGCDAYTTTLTSDDFTVNSLYNGGGVTNMLTGNDDLSVGDKGAVLLTVNACGCGDGTTIENSATVSSMTPSGDDVDDDSNNGSDPDGDDNDDNPDEEGTTDYTIEENPSIGVAKRAVSAELMDDGCTELVYEFNIENFGDVVLNDIQVVDDLIAAGFGSCGGYTTSLTSDDFTVNANYNGDTDTNLLTGGDDIPVGDVGAILLTVNACGCVDGTSIMNSATAIGTSPSGEEVEDDSNNGSDPDGDDDDDNPDEDGTTDTTIGENPSIGGAKRVADAQLTSDGSFVVTYEINIENFGDVDLSNVQAVDDLAATFTGTCDITNIVVTSDDFQVNPLYDGVGVTDLLTGNDILEVGDKGAVLLEVTVADCAGTGPFVNTATVSGESPSGEEVEDDTVNGSDPDDDGDGDPTNDDSDTPFELTEEASLGVAKYVKDGPTNNGDGTYNISFGIRLENMGNVDLSNMSVVDDLVAAFNGCDYEVSGVSSEEFAVNTDYNGDDDIELLESGQTLKSWDEGEICINIVFGPCMDLGPFTNSATGSGETPSGEGVEDDSQNGSNPDPDGDGDPENNDDPTGPIEFEENPAIGGAKRVVSADNNGDGSYTVIYEINIENYGDILLNDIQAVDDLSTTFPAPCTTDIAITSDDFILNPSYGNGGDWNLIGVNETLLVGDKGAVLIEVTIEDCASFGTFINTANVSGTSPSGEEVEDDTDDGSDPDGDGDGDPSNDDDGTPVDLTENPLIGLAKRLVSVTTNSDGSADATYEFNVENFGDVLIDNIQVTDDFGAAFAPCSVTMASFTSDDFTVNPDFDGVIDINLLLGTDDLPVGDKGAILVTVHVEACNGDNGPFMNSATATGDGPTGPVSDDSSDGSDPDPDGDGDPTNDDGTTDVSFNFETFIGVAKNVVYIQPKTDGTVDVAFEFNIENFGNQILMNLQLEDNLGSAFAACDIEIVALTSDDFSVNSVGFDGVADFNLLLGNDDIQPGDEGSVDLIINLANCADDGPFYNSAKVTAEDADGNDVFDDFSTDGSDPDPDGDGDPTNNNNPTEVDFGFDPDLGVSKRLSYGPILSTEGCYDITFEIKVENFGDVDLYNVQVFEDLTSTFDFTLDIVTIISLESEEFDVNANFDGDTDTELLSGNDTLVSVPGGNEGGIYLTLNVCPSGNT